MWSPFVKRGQEVHTSPPSLDHSKDVTRPGVPPTYAYTQRREPHVGAGFLASPDSQYNVYTDNTPERLGVSGWQDAPDPLRQSNFWADGRKIHPHARMPRQSNLNIADILSHMSVVFSAGKLKQHQSVPQFAGTQLPSVQRYNIREGYSSTYGSLYEVDPATPPPVLVLASGMSYTQSQDGHPY